MLPAQLLSGGVVHGFAVPGGNRYSRSQLDGLVDQAKQMGFTGLIWVRPGEPPVCSVKALGEATLRPALDRVQAGKDHPNIRQIEPVLQL